MPPLFSPPPAPVIHLPPMMRRWGSRKTFQDLLPGYNRTQEHRDAVKLSVLMFQMREKLRRGFLNESWIVFSGSIVCIHLEEQSCHGCFRDRIFCFSPAVLDIISGWTRQDFFFLINERFQINYIVYYSIVYTVRIPLERMLESRYNECHVKIFQFNECYLNS